MAETPKFHDPLSKPAIVGGALPVLDQTVPDIIEVVWPYYKTLIKKHYMGLEITGASIGLGSLIAVNNGQISVQAGLLLCMTARGVLLGPENELGNMIVVPTRVPTDREARTFIDQICQGLRDAKNAQASIVPPNGQEDLSQ